MQTAGGWELVTAPSGKIVANVNAESGIELAAMPAQANARLIAAAPELLEALQELLPHAFEYWSEYGGNDDYIARARAAIAKASLPQVHET